MNFKTSHNYKIVKTIEYPHVFIVSDSDEEYIMKVERRGKKVDFGVDVSYSKRFGNLDIAPKFIDSIIWNGNRAFVTEKMDYCLDDLIEEDDFDDIRDDLISMINQKVTQLHLHDICHGDLHTGNIVVNLNPLSVRIIDFELCFVISKGKSHPNVKERLKEYSSYEDLIRCDYTTWLYEL